MFWDDCMPGTWLCVLCGSAYWVSEPAAPPERKWIGLASQEVYFIRKRWKTEHGHTKIPWDLLSLLLDPYWAESSQPWHSSSLLLLFLGFWKGCKTHFLCSLLLSDSRLMDSQRVSDDRMRACQPRLWSLCHLCCLILGRSCFRVACSWANQLDSLILWAHSTVLIVAAASPPSCGTPLL